MPFWGQRKIVNLAFWSLVISHFVTFHTSLMCVISGSHVTIWSCTLHWFTREDAECVPDHEPIRHRELLEALSFQGTQIQAVRHHGSGSSYQLPVATYCCVLASASSTGTVVMYRRLVFHLSQPCPLTGWSWAAPPWPLFPVSPARTLEYPMRAVSTTANGYPQDRLHCR